jgi:hypothetical protein
MMRCLVSLTLVLLAAAPARSAFVAESYDPARHSYPVSVQAAMGIIRDWSEDAGLGLVLLHVRRWQGEGNGGVRWVFRSTDQQQEFQVDAHTGWINVWENHAAMAAAESARRNAPTTFALSEAQAIHLGSEFARQRYPGFEDLHLTRVWESSRQVSFHTTLPGAIVFPLNWCTVSMDRRTGAVLLYEAGQAGPVLVSTTPTLTAADAEHIALGSFVGQPGAAVGFIAGPSEREVWQDSFGSQALGWRVKLLISDDPSTLAVEAETVGRGWEVLLYDHNGAIYHRIQFLGSGTKGRKPSGRRVLTRKTVPSATSPRQPAPAPLKLRVNGLAVEAFFPPVWRDGTIWLYAGYLRSPQWGASATLRGRELTLAGPTGVRQVLAVPGPQTWRRNGRTYVPARTWRAVTGDQVVWDRRTRTVSLTRAAPGR